MASAMGKVRFGMIGCGEIAMQSVKALQAAGETCVIAAVQDVVEALAKDTGERLGVPYFTDAADLLKRDDVDAVVVSTPHFLHEPLTLQAAKAGKHVACEKPIACTLAQAKKMIDACRKAKVLLSVNFVSRYDQSVVKTGELVRAGAIGKIIRYQANGMADKPESYWSGGYTGRAKSDWRQSVKKSGGGVLIMNLIHDFDRVLALTGLKPKRVYAESDTHCTPVEVEDNISVVVRFSNGAIGSLDAMSCARGKESFGNRLYGTQGQIVMGRPLRVFTTRDDLPGLKKGEWNNVEVDGAEYGGDQRKTYFVRFARSILDGAKKAEIPGEEATKSLALCLAAYESAKKKKPVEIRG